LPFCEKESTLNYKLKTQRGNKMTAEQYDRMVTKAAETRNMAPGDYQWARQEYARMMEQEAAEQK